jgi:hypothetical protein
MGCSASTAVSVFCHLGTDMQAYAPPVRKQMALSQPFCSQALCDAAWLTTCPFATATLKLPDPILCPDTLFETQQLFKPAPSGRLSGMWFVRHLLLSVDLHRGYTLDCPIILSPCQSCALQRRSTPITIYEAQHHASTTKQTPKPATVLLQIAAICSCLLQWWR